MPRKTINFNIKSFVCLFLLFLCKKDPPFIYHSSLFYVLYIYLYSSNRFICLYSYHGFWFAQGFISNHLFSQETYLSSIINERLRIPQEQSEMSHMGPTKKPGVNSGAKGKQFLPLIRHPPCY